MSNNKILAVITGVLILATSTSVGNSSPAPQPAQATLATATNIKCTFSLVAISAMRTDQPKVEVKPASLVLQFETINADEGTAELKSDFGGKFDIIVRYTKGYLHFVQSFLDGRLYATTVLDKKTTTGKLKAAHSRHEYTDASLPGWTSSPEQYYGECDILSSK